MRARRQVLLLLLGAGMAAAVPAPAPAQDAPQGDARAGRRLAGARCALCHGRDGIAVQPDAPNLAGQNPAYVRAQLGHFRSGERKHEQMNVVAAELTEPQITDLAAWYSSIGVTATLPGR